MVLLNLDWAGPLGGGSAAPIFNLLNRPIAPQVQSVRQDLWMPVWPPAGSWGQNLRPELEARTWDLIWGRILIARVVRWEARVQLFWPSRGKTGEMKQWPLTRANISGFLIGKPFPFSARELCTLGLML
ncbi:MAG: hypothetical protein EBY21_09495 [Alphaproteobacteria bacterium]|nr:hypothetical protein [Alphaproteobacteria bacterium]